MLSSFLKYYIVMQGYENDCAEQNKTKKMAKSLHFFPKTQHSVTDNITHLIKTKNRGVFFSDVIIPAL